jgi:hypothetical protein
LSQPCRIGGGDEPEDALADDELVVAEELLVGEVVEELGNLVEDVIGVGANGVGQLASRMVYRRDGCHDETSGVKKQIDASTKAVVYKSSTNSAAAYPTISKEARKTGKEISNS